MTQINSIPAFRYQNPLQERGFYPFAAHAALPGAAGAGERGRNAVRKRLVFSGKEKLPWV